MSICHAAAGMIFHFTGNLGERTKDPSCSWRAGRGTQPHVGRLRVSSEQFANKTVALPQHPSFQEGTLRGIDGPSRQPCVSLAPRCSCSRGPSPTGALSPLPALHPCSDVAKMAPGTSLMLLVWSLCEGPLLEEEGKKEEVNFHICDLSSFKYNCVSSRKYL